GPGGVRAGAARIPPQGPGARARPRDETPLPLRAAGRGSQDEEPARPPPPNPLVPSPLGGEGRVGVSPLVLRAPLLPPPPSGGETEPASAGLVDLSQVTLAEPEVPGSHLQQFVLGQKVERLLQAEPRSGGEADRDVGR